MRPIVCVTEFTEKSVEALRVASALARHFEERVLLVHSVDEREQFPRGLREDLARQDQARLDAEAERMRSMGMPVDARVLTGVPENGVATFAARCGARLVVLGCEPLSRSDAWVLGCLAEQIATTSTVPTLVVRESGPVLEWLNGRRPLRVFAAVDAADHSPFLYRTLSEMRATSAEPLEVHEDEIKDPRHLSDEAARCIAAAQAHHADLVAVGTEPETELPLLTHRTLAGCLFRKSPVGVLCVPNISRVRSGARDRRTESGFAGPIEPAHPTGA